MKIVDCANEIYLEMGSPSDTSIPAIASWIRGQIGKINSLLFEDFVINSALEVVDGDGEEITPEALSVIKQLYVVYDRDIQIRSNLNSISTSSILEVTDQGSSVKKINRNEVSKTISALRKDDLAELRNLITAYRIRGTTPSQVAGDDTTSNSPHLNINYRTII